MGFTIKVQEYREDTSWNETAEVKLIIDDEYKDLWVLDTGNIDNNKAVMHLNARLWAELAKVSNIEEITSCLKGNEFDEFAFLDLDCWESPSQYFEDPGDGGYTATMTSLPDTPDELYEILKEDTLDYLTDIPKADKEKLADVIPGLANTLKEDYRDYTESN